VQLKFAIFTFFSDYAKMNICFFLSISTPCVESSMRGVRTGREDWKEGCKDSSDEEEKARKGTGNVELTQIIV